MKRHFAVRIIGFLILSAVSSSVFAQEAATETDIANRINRLINASMESVRIRADTFNHEVVAINAIEPFTLEHLDSATVAANSAKVLAFTEFLSGFNASGDSLARSMEDSLFILKQESPDIAKDKFVTGFESSFNADRIAFDNYVVTLRKQYQQVLTSLLFLQGAKYSITHKRLEFAKKEDVAQYEKLMQQIDATAVELKKASAESKKATDAANKMIAKLNKPAKAKRHVQ